MSRGGSEVRPSGGRTSANRNQVPGDGEGRGPGTRKRGRRARPSPSDLPPAERRQKARDVALGLLARRERSRAELTSRLKARGYDRETIEGVLDGLAASGLQSDQRFAEAFAGEAHRSRGLAGSAVRGELLRRGIDRKLAVEAATETPESEEARARELALARARRLPADLRPDARIRRIAGYLARRGYPPDVCFRMAADAVSAGEDPPRELPLP